MLELSFWSTTGATIELGIVSGVGLRTRPIKPLTPQILSFIISLVLFTFTYSLKSRFCLT